MNVSLHAPPIMLITTMESVRNVETVKSTQARYAMMEIFKVEMGAQELVSLKQVMLVLYQEQIVFVR